jgi:DNA processing protein
MEKAIDLGLAQTMDEHSAQSERAYWLAWSQIPGIGSILLHRIRQEFSDLAIAWHVDAQRLQQVDGIGVGLSKRIEQCRQQFDPIAFLAQYEQANTHFWTPSDPAYPIALREIADPPICLHYQGQAEALEKFYSQPRIAMVGTRQPTEYGKRWTQRISQFLAQQGFTIVSGLAEGVDAEAHRACLQVGGYTIAVLGHGLDQCYPPSHRKLFQQIAQQGLLLSEYPVGTAIDRSFFPQRNRIVAGLCHATLVLEAGNQSGALITARLANESGRDVYALAGNLDNPQTGGCIHLILHGAQIIPPLDQLLELLHTSLGIAQGTRSSYGVTQNGVTQNSLASAQTSAQTSLPLTPAIPQVDPALQGLVDAIAALNNMAPLDMIVQQTQWPIGAVSSGLLQLELAGIVEQIPGMRYRIL